MKKTFFILFSLMLLTACSASDQNGTPSSSTPAVEEDAENNNENNNPPVEEEVENEDEDEEVDNEGGKEAFVEDKITVNTPKINDEISSPVTVRGEARGTWFSEGSFVVKLLDANQKELTHENATSTKEWMTEEFIPFQAVLTFDMSNVDTDTGTIILEKDNPSGLPENAGKLEIPVKF